MPPMDFEEVVWSGAGSDYRCSRAKKGGVVAPSASVFGTRTAIVENWSYCRFHPIRSYAAAQLLISLWAMIGKMPGVVALHCATVPV